MYLPPTYSEEKDVHVLIETPKGSCNKYEYDPATSLFFLRKILPSGVVFPLDFGFVPATKSMNGNPLEALVLMEQPTFPGIVVPCRPIGILKARQKDKKGDGFIRNDRLLLVAKDSKVYSNVREISDLEDYFINSINHFFEYYHEREGGKFILIGIKGCAEALEMIEKLQKN